MRELVSRTSIPPGKGHIHLLDVLRGVAIFGTLGTNIWLFSTVGSGGATIFGGGLAWWASFDGFLTTLALFITNGKFLGLLTILVRRRGEDTVPIGATARAGVPVRYL